MNKKRREDVEHKARKDAESGSFEPPHSGAFGLRSTVLGRKYSESEKEDRRAYKREYRHHKS